MAQWKSMCHPPLWLGSIQAVGNFLCPLGHGGYLPWESEKYSRSCYVIISHVLSAKILARVTVRVRVRVRIKVKIRFRITIRVRIMVWIC